MALYGVIADIHGNREALGVALAALASRHIEQLLCLGDLVGYNADPDECVALVREQGALAIAGNHDLIGLGRLDSRRCSNKAAYALRRTRARLAPETRDYLAALPPYRELGDGVVLVHGGVRDVQQYMIGPDLLLQNAAYLGQDFPRARVCFFGHSHEQKVYRIDADRVEELPWSGRIGLDRNARYFVNPGAVDASRKRGPKLAECALFDSAARTLELLRLPYDAAAAEAKAAAFGYRMTPLIEHAYALRRRLRRLSWRRATAR